VIRDALQWIGGLREEALEPIKIVDREDRKLFLSRDGRQLDVRIPSCPRCHQVETIDDLAVAVKRWGTLKSVVFHGNREIVFVLDDADRRDKVVLVLEPTDVWARVVELGDQQFDQRSFLRLLRHDLAGVIPANLVTAIQKIEVVTSVNQRSEMAPGRERGTREFASDLHDSGAIPEVVTLMVPVYRLEGLCHPLPVKCSLEYTLPPSPVTFLFRPLPDQIDRVLLSLQGDLHRLLVDALRVDECMGPDVLFGSL